MTSTRPAAGAAGKEYHYPCPKCSQRFSQPKYVHRHLKSDQHNVLDCPFPNKCPKIYTNYMAMVRHLRDDTQDHNGLGINDIHKLVAEHPHVGLKPDEWILELFRIKKSDRLRRKATEKGSVKQHGENSTPLSWKYDLAHQEHQGRQESAGAPMQDNDEPDYIALDDSDDDPMQIDEEEEYQSEPEDWWKR
ncbi:hypothetical protein PG989_004215 [Apiospora arundinis]